MLLIDTCAHEILETVPLIMRTIRSEMRRHRGNDLTVPQLRTLIFLNRKPGAPLANLAEHLGLTPPSASVLIDGLVERGLVTRVTPPGDRRRVALALTEQGCSLLQVALDGAYASLTEMLKDLSEEECALVVKALRRLRPVFTFETAPNTDVK